MGILTHRNRRSRNAIRPLPVPQRASFDLARNPRTPESWVKDTSRWTNFLQECGIEAKSGCSRGKQQRNTAHSGSGVPGPL